MGWPILPKLARKEGGFWNFHLRVIGKLGIGFGRKNWVRKEREDLLAFQGLLFWVGIGGGN